MCGPALGLIGAGVSAIGSLAAAEGQASQAEYNAQVARINARSDRQKGYVQQERLDDKYDKLRGQGITAASKGGVDSGYGSAALIIFGENEATRSADKNTAYVNAEGAAIANENKARDLEAQAGNQRTAGMFGATTSFLNGLGGAMKGGGLNFNLNAG
jgi:hypothetical protein